MKKRVEAFGRDILSRAAECNLMAAEFHIGLCFAGEYALLEVPGKSAEQARSRYRQTIEQFYLGMQMAFDEQENSEIH